MLFTGFLGKKQSGSRQAIKIMSNIFIISHQRKGHWLQGILINLVYIYNFVKPKVFKAAQSPAIQQIAMFCPSFEHITH